MRRRRTTSRGCARPTPSTPRRRESSRCFPRRRRLSSDFASAVAAGAGLADILAERRVIEPVQPRLVLEDGAAWLVIPDGVGYPAR